MIINEKGANEDVFQPKLNPTLDFTIGTETENALAEANANFVNAVGDAMGETARGVIQAGLDGGEAVVNGITLSTITSYGQQNLGRAIANEVKNMVYVNIVPNPAEVKSNYNRYENPDLAMRQAITGQKQKLKIISKTLKNSSAKATNSVTAVRMKNTQKIINKAIQELGG